MILDLYDKTPCAAEQGVISAYQGAKAPCSAENRDISLLYAPSVEWPARSDAADGTASSVRRRGGAAELHLAQRQRERRGPERDQHQDPEDIRIGQERRLEHDLLADPGDGLVLRLSERAAMGDEIAASPAAACADTGCSTGSRARRAGSDGTARDAPSTLEASEMPIEPPVLRAALIERRGHVGLVGRNPVVGRGHDRDEDQRQPDAEQHARTRRRTRSRDRRRHWSGRTWRAR